MKIVSSPSNPQLRHYYFFVSKIGLILAWVSNSFSFLPHQNLMGHSYSIKHKWPLRAPWGIHLELQQLLHNTVAITFFIILMCCFCLITGLRLDYDTVGCSQRRRMHIELSKGVVSAGLAWSTGLSAWHSPTGRTMLGLAPRPSTTWHGTRGHDYDRWVRLGTPGMTWHIGPFRHD